RNAKSGKSDRTANSARRIDQWLALHAPTHVLTHDVTHVPMHTPVHARTHGLTQHGGRLKEGQCAPHRASSPSPRVRPGPSRPPGPPRPPHQQPSTMAAFGSPN